MKEVAGRLHSRRCGAPARQAVEPNPNIISRTRGPPRHRGAGSSATSACARPSKNCVGLGRSGTQREAGVMAVGAGIATRSTTAKRRDQHHRYAGELIRALLRAGSGADGLGHDAAERWRLPARGDAQQGHVRRPKYRQGTTSSARGQTRSTVEDTRICASSPKASGRQT